MADNLPKPKPKIESIEGIEPRRPIDQMAESHDVSGPDKIKFDQALEKADPSRAQIELRSAAPVQEQEVTRKQNVLDMAKAAAKAPEKIQMPASNTSIMQNAASLREQMQRPKAVLMSFENQGIPLPAQQAGEMMPRVAHMDQALIDAQKTTTGVEVTSNLATSTERPPAVRFLNFLTDADKRLDTIVSEVSTYTSQGMKMSPEKLLAVQVKLNFVQQELEFFTNVLNRAVETVKTLMNVQI